MTRNEYRREPFSKSAEGRRRRHTRRIAIARKAAFLAML